MSAVLLRILIITLCLAGCKDYEYRISSASALVTYPTHALAARAFYRENMGTIKTLNENQELLGYLVKCGPVYTYTSYQIGGITNAIHTEEVDHPLSCTVYGHLHTHPDKGVMWTTNFFSKADLHLSLKMPVYMLSTRECELHYAVGGKGQSLGKYQCK